MPSTEAPIHLEALAPEAKVRYQPARLPIPAEGQRMPQNQAEKLWRKDRVTIRACDGALYTTVTHYEDLTAQLSRAAK